MEEKTLQELKEENDKSIKRIEEQLDAIIMLIKELNDKMRGGYNV